MRFERVHEFLKLNATLGAPKRFGLSLDVGHLLVTGEGSPVDVIRRNAQLLFTVALEDMKPGVHDHLPFGMGSLDLPAVIAALRAAGFSRVASVELPRHGFDAVRWAEHSKQALSAAGVAFGRS